MQEQKWPEMENILKIRHVECGPDVFNYIQKYSRVIQGQNNTSEGITEDKPLVLLKPFHSNLKVLSVNDPLPPPSELRSLLGIRQNKIQGKLLVGALCFLLASTNLWHYRSGKDEGSMYVPKAINTHECGGARGQSCWEKAWE